MFISPAYAQAPTGGMGDLFNLLVPMLAVFAIFYFFMIRPQQQRMKAQQAMLDGIRKGDTIVTSGGVIGKVKGVADDELRVEIAPNVEVRVERAAVASVRNRTEPAPANDSKPAKD